MRDNNAQVDRFWVRRFVERNSNTFVFKQTKLLEKARHEMSVDNLKRYFDAVAIHLKTVPSTFVWNADEIRLGAITQ
jgi:hypothetical protein